MRSALNPLQTKKKACKLKMSLKLLLLDIAVHEAEDQKNTLRDWKLKHKQQNPRNTPQKILSLTLLMHFLVLQMELKSLFPISSFT